MEYSQKKFSVSEIMTKVSNGTRGKFRAVSELIEHYSKDNDSFKVEDIVKESNGTFSDVEVEKVVNQMKQEATIYEPKKGNYRVL